MVPRYGQLPLLFVYGSEKLLDDVAASLRGSTPEALRMALCPVRAGQSFAVGSYRFTAIPANHPVPGDVSFNYLIEDQAGRALLYGLDGGTPPEEAWELLEGRQLDAVILDATTGFTGHGAASNHMSLHDVREVVARLRKIGALGARFPGGPLPHQRPPLAAARRGGAPGGTGGDGPQLRRDVA